MNGPEILVDPQTHTVYIRWPGSGLYSEYPAGYPGDLPAPAPGCIAYVPAADVAPVPAPTIRPARRPVATVTPSSGGRGWRSA